MLCDAKENRKAHRHYPFELPERVLSTVLNRGSPRRVPVPAAVSRSSQHNEPRGCQCDDVASRDAIPPGSAKYGPCGSETLHLRRRAR
jgi:hypothetical protein